MRSQYFRFAVLLVSALALAGCMQNLSGFPENPETLEGFEKYFGSKILGEYHLLKSEADKRNKRDEIIGGQVAAIDKVFGELERSLFQSAALP